MTAPCADGYTAPHQTSEPWPFVATYRGTPVVDNVQACLLVEGGPGPVDGDWLPAILVDEGNGTTSTNVLVSDRGPGWYTVWAQVNRGGRAIVLKLQTIHLT